MPNIFFASNNMSHFPTATSSNLLGTFDPTRVPYSIAATQGEVLNSPKFVPPTGNFSWLHFRTFFTGTNYNEGAVMVKGYDAKNSLLFDIRKRSATDEGLLNLILYNGTSSVTVATTLPMTRNKMNFIDISLETSNFQIQLKVYVNGSLAGTATLGSNPNDYETIARFSLGHAFKSNETSPQFYSEIIVADDDTRNARLNLLRPNAGGAYEQWLGNLNVLSDDDTTTGMTTIAPDTRQSVKLTPYTGAANVSNFVTISTTTRGKNSPSKLQHSIRLSGVDYDGPVLNLPFELAYQITDFQINPATSLPWTAADIAAIETGFISRA